MGPNKVCLELELQVPPGATSQGMVTCTPYLSLQLALGKGHHFLVGHLGEKRSVLVQAETF